MHSDRPPTAAILVFFKRHRLDHPGRLVCSVYLTLFNLTLNFKTILNICCELFSGTSPSKDLSLDSLGISYLLLFCGFGSHLRKWRIFVERGR